MAILVCKECGGKVSDKATNCPHCGAPVEISKFQNLQSKVCPECGQSLDVDCKECINCGYMFEDIQNQIYEVENIKTGNQYHSISTFLAKYDSGIAILTTIILVAIFSLIGSYIDYYNTVHLPDIAHGNMTGINIPAILFLIPIIIFLIPILFKNDSDMSLFSIKKVIIIMFIIAQMLPINAIIMGIQQKYNLPNSDMNIISATIGWLPSVLLLLLPFALIKKNKFIYSLILSIAIVLFRLYFAYEIRMPIWEEAIKAI